jgi:hypothetical protein
MPFELEAWPLDPGRRLTILGPGLSADDLDALRRAVGELERRTFASRLAAVLRRRETGMLHWPIPSHITDLANRVAGPAVETSMKVALGTLEGKPLRDRRRFHKGIAALAGGAGGAFGLSSFVFELPFTTTIMLRAIADIARNEGEDLSDPSTALACLAVFGLGGGPRSVTGAAGTDTELGLDAGYFAVRTLLAAMVKDTVPLHLARTSTAEASSVLARYIAGIAARFGVVVSQKLAAQAVPMIGAAAGAAINYAFVDHFQTVAHGHFTILRLERRYGAAVVRQEYELVLRQA